MKLMLLGIGLMLGADAIIRMISVGFMHIDFFMSVLGFVIVMIGFFKNDDEDIKKKSDATDELMKNDNV